MSASPTSESETRSTPREQNTPQELKQRTKARVHQAADDAKQHLEARAERGRKAGVTVLHDLAASARQAAEELRAREDATPATVVDRVADACDDLSERLDTTDCRAMCRHAVDGMRRHPGPTIATAFAIGLVASRLLKASERERHDREPADAVDRSEPASLREAADADRYRTERPAVHTTGISPARPGPAATPTYAETNR